MRTIDVDALLAEFDRREAEPEYQHEGEDWYCGLISGEELVMEAPTIETERRWIPVSERMPKEETYVLISKKPSPLSGKKWCVTVAGRFIDGRSRKVEWRDIGFGRIYDDDVLAWMPLPEPYKKEGGE